MQVLTALKEKEKVRTIKKIGINMKNKNQIIIVLVLVILVGAVYLLTNRPSNSSVAQYQNCLQSASQKYNQMVAANCVPAGDPKCQTSWTAMNFFETQREANIKACEAILNAKN